MFKIQVKGIFIYKLKTNFLDYSFVIFNFLQKEIQFLIVMK